MIVFEDLDELARGLAENGISRRQAIKWAGYSVLGAALSSIGFAESAEALTRRQRRRCRRKGGALLEKGNCHCAIKCDAPDLNNFTCQNNRNCACFQTTVGRGFCASLNVSCLELPSCSRDSQCPSGWKCVFTCCPGTSSVLCLPPCGVKASSAQQTAASSSAMTPNGRPSGG